MAHRLAVAVVALGVIASSWPLDRAVRQEYVPSNVDEGEFEIGVTAPEGASLAAMTEVARRVEIVRVWDGRLDPAGLRLSH